MKNTKGEERATNTNSYETHTFYFTEVGNKEAEVARVTIVPGDAGAIAPMNEGEKFSDECLCETGIIWRHYFGPDRPRLPHKSRVAYKYLTRSELRDIPTAPTGYKR